jgi:BlaI family penicillinase repressor
MKPNCRISEAEWDVMEVFWQRSPQTSSEVHEALHPNTHWKSTTVRTLISRLLAKGILEHVVDGKRYLYSAAQSRDECVEAASQSFLERIFGGSVQPLLLHFASRTRLSKRDAEKLKELLGGSKS